MKKNDITEIDNALNDFSDNHAKLIKVSLDTKNSIKKMRQGYPDQEIIKSEFDSKD